MPIKLDTEKGRSHIDIPPAMFPDTLMLPGFTKAGIFVYGPTPMTTKANLWIRNKRTNAPDLAKHLERGAWARAGYLKYLEYMQMLAKIAYVHAVGELGLGAFRPIVTDLILNGSSIPHYWIGGTGGLAAPATALHELSIERKEYAGEHFALVWVRLFAVYGAPTNYVVVGQLS